MSIIELNVKEKGRTVLPVELQKACGFKPGDVLLVEEVSEGRFLVETKKSKIQRLWALAQQVDHSVTTKELLRQRSEQEEARLEKLAKPTLTTGQESDKRAAALLAAVLGE